MRRAALLIAAIHAIHAIASSAGAEEPINGAMVYATDDPRVFQLRLPESMPAPTEPPKIELTNYLCEGNGDGICSCAACRNAVARETVTFDYLVFEMDPGGWGPSGARIYDQEILHGGRFAFEREEADGGGYRFDVEAFGGAVDVDSSSYSPYYPYFRSGQTDGEVLFGRFHFDFFQRVRVGRTDLKIGVGPVLAMTHFDSGAGYSEQIYAGGVSAFLDFKQRLGSVGETEFSVIGHGRIDYMQDSTDGQNSWSIFQSASQVRELNIGAEARRRLDDGDLILQAVYESQQWSGHNHARFDGLRLSIGRTW